MTSSEKKPVEIEAVPSEELPNVAARREYSILSLMELSQELSVSLDIYKLADMALFILMGQLGTSKAAFWIADAEADRNLVLLRSNGINAKWNWVLESVCVARILEQDYESSSLSLKQLNSGLDPAGKNIMAEAEIGILVPIVSNGKTVAVMAFGNKVSGEPYEIIDMQVLQSSLSMLGVAIENTRLYNRMLENNRQLRKANEDLENLDELKLEFMRNVNHELRTPLTIVIAYLDILRNKELNEEKRNEFLDGMAEQSEKLNQLLEQLLDFAEAVGQSVQTKMLQADIRPVVKACFEERLPGVTDGLRDFQLNLPDDALVASHDPEHIKKILDILVDNATKFTPTGARIVLRAGQAEDGQDLQVLVSVEDNGPGIPEEKRQNVFESFRQGDGSTRREVGGMGMGLALARTLAQEMGGEIVVDSEIGRGSTFTLLLHS